MAKEQKGKRQAAKNSDKELQKTVVAALKEGKTLREVADDHNITPGKAAFLRMCADVKPKERIKADSEEELAKKIVSARNHDKLGWGHIAARSGVPEGRVKKIYEKTTGKSTKGMRLEGKGGRPPSGEVKAPKKAAKSTGRKRGAEAAEKKTATSSKAKSGRKRGRSKGKQDPSKAA